MAYILIGAIVSIALGLMGYGVFRSERETGIYILAEVFTFLLIRIANL